MLHNNKAIETQDTRKTFLGQKRFCNTNTTIYNIIKMFFICSIVGFFLLKQTKYDEIYVISI
jgi:hypothetical protein